MRSKEATKITKVITAPTSTCAQAPDGKHVWEDPHSRDEWLKGYKICAKCGRITSKQVLCD